MNCCEFHKNIVKLFPLNSATIRHSTNNILFLLELPIVLSTYNGTKIASVLDGNYEISYRIKAD